MSCKESIVAILTYQSNPTAPRLTELQPLEGVAQPSGLLKAPQAIPMCGQIENTSVSLLVLGQGGEERGNAFDFMLQGFKARRQARAVVLLTLKLWEDRWWLCHGLKPQDSRLCQPPRTADS